MKFTTKKTINQLVTELKSHSASHHGGTTTHATIVNNTIECIFIDSHGRNVGNCILDFNDMSFTSRGRCKYRAGLKEHETARF